MILFKTREEGGKKLAEKLSHYQGKKNLLILAVPRGGVAVGAPVAKKLQAPFDVIVLRKIPIPWDPEAGFGAVTLNGAITLNEPLVKSLVLTKEEIEKEAAKVKKEVERRTKIYRKGKSPLKLKNKIVILIDDGLASGYTMLAAVKALKKEKAKKIIIATPVASHSAYRLLKPKVDELITLHIEPSGAFAVASFYEEFPDLTDKEVIKYLNPKS